MLKCGKAPKGLTLPWGLCVCIWKLFINCYLQKITAPCSCPRMKTPAFPPTGHTAGLKAHNIFSYNSRYFSDKVIVYIFFKPLDPYF